MSQDIGTSEPSVRRFFTLLGEHRCWDPIGFSGFVEGVSNDVVGYSPMDRNVERVAGVVIEPGNGFGVGLSERKLIEQRPGDYKPLGNGFVENRSFCVSANVM